MTIRKMKVYIHIMIVLGNINLQCVYIIIITAKEDMRYMRRCKIAQGEEFGDRERERRHLRERDK